jgi:hypothetical protein
MKRLINRVLNLCVGIVVLAAMAAPGHAQVTATISGKVQDASGAAVSGATITVKSLETGATRTVTADDTGNFRVLSVSVGRQEVRAERTGFKASVRSGINLEVEQEAVVNLQLDVGDFIQEVRIVAEVPVINTTTAQISGLVGEREVKDLPLNGRSFDNLIALNSGAINYSAMKSANTTTSSGNTFSVAGRRTGDNLVLLNGIEYTGTSQLAVTPGGVSGDLLGIDAIREFNVLTGTYSAQYGKRSGAQVSVVTQSGSNQLHGSVFEFLRNSALDARNFFDQGSVPLFQRNQFGGAAGGPIKKDRLFLFGNYEGFRQRLGLSNVAVVPDQQARLGLLPNASGVYTPVPNLNSAMLPYTSFWPQPNGPELLVNGLPSGVALAYNHPKQSIQENFGNARADYTPRNRDSLSAVYTFDTGDSLTPAADTLFATRLALRMQVLSLHETHVISPRMLNTFSAGFSRAAYNIDSVTTTTFSPNLSFVTGAGPGGISIGGGTTGGTITGAGASNSNVWNRRNLFTYTDGLQISSGIHQIAAGIWFQRLHHNDHTASRTQGQAAFTSLQTFLQGTVNNFQVVPNPTEVGWRSLLGAWYVDDSMKLRQNLTFRAGIRNEFTTGWNEVAGRASNFITDAQGVLLTDPRVANTTFTKNNAKRLFGPRVALAWDPAGNGKTAIRAGFGVYYTLIDNLAFLLNSLPPHNGSVTFTGSLFAFLPITHGVQPPPACGPTAPARCSTFAPQGVEKAAKAPTVNEWNITIERQLGSNMALRAGYTGSFGYHGLLSVDPNSIPAQICASSSGCAAGGMSATPGAVPQNAQYIPLGTRPNPYLSAGFFWYGEGNSSYNALQLEVIRRLSRGLQFRTNYTWSKNLDLNSGLTGAQAQNQPQMVMDRNDLRRDWGPSALTPTHQASISVHYELPLGDGKARGLTNKLIGGWQLNAITTLLSGFPFTPQIGSNRSGDGNTRNPDRPSLNPSFSGPALPRKQTKWFDPNAFILPAVGTWGNLGRGTFKGPGLADVDLSISKNIALTEKTSLQFRTEFFNTLNQTNLGTPNPIVFSGTAINPSAGLITTTATTARQIQFGLKLIF